MQSTRTQALSALLVLAAGCGDAADFGARAPVESAPIVNGTASPSVVNLTALQRLAVGAVLTRDGRDWTNTCTGTLITRDVVLTAAHCVVDDNGNPVSPADVAFALGDDAAQPRESANAQQIHVHPGYDEDGMSAQNDVAILVLEGSLAGAEPLPINCHTLTQSALVGRAVQNVGYGDTDTDGSDNTRKWWSAQKVVALSSFDFTVDGNGETGVCSGDSGGPSLWTMNGNVHVVGVLSWGDAECGYRDHFARVDAHCPFIQDFLPAEQPATPTTQACSIDGVTLDGPTLQRALTFLETMTCQSCDAVLDARTCEDAINDPAQCQVGAACTQCGDTDTRSNGVSCAELAGYAYVGASAARALISHVNSLTPVTTEIEGVTFTGEDITRVLDLVNRAEAAELDDTVGLDSRAASGIVDARPFSTLEALAAVSYVGSSALAALLAYVQP